MIRQVCQGRYTNHPDTLNPLTDNKQRGCSKHSNMFYDITTRYFTVVVMWKEVSRTTLDHLRPAPKWFEWTAEFFSGLGDGGLPIYSTSGSAAAIPDTGHVSALVTGRWREFTVMSCEKLSSSPEEGSYTSGSRKFTVKAASI
jgi:hypothetical protein